MDEGTETCVADMYSVVYKLEKGEWAPQGKGWSQIRLYYDSSDDTYRIVGWTVSTLDVVINCNIIHNCSYRVKSPDFHKLKTGYKESFGFGFYKKDESLKEAEAFCKKVNNAIAHDAAKELAKRRPHHPSMVAPEVKHLMHTVKNEQIEDLWDKEVRAFKMGNLKILPPRPSKAKSQNLAAPNQISDVTKVKHTCHVKFDPKTRKYTGLPQKWEQKLSKQFGLSPKQVENTQIPKYKSRIPIVLVQMKTYLLNNGGLEQEGIFRLAPDQNTCLVVKKQLEDGTFTKCDDVNCIANLIKVWFRELPQRLLAGVDPERIKACKDPNEAAEIVSSMAEPNQSILLWLLDLLVMVAQWQHVNKMGPQNLAIVISPNLFSAEKLDPMAGLIYSQKVALFLYKAIIAAASRVGASIETKKQ